MCEEDPGGLRLGRIALTISIENRLKIPLTKLNYDKTKVTVL